MHMYYFLNGGRPVDAQVLLSKKSKSKRCVLIYQLEFSVKIVK